MMKKITLTCTALVALFAANVGAAGSTNYATTAGAGSKATATVHFTGEIVASTCVVNTANPTNTNVVLPQVTNQLFGGAGSTTGDTQFTLQFTGCSGATGAHSYVVVFTGKITAVIPHCWKQLVQQEQPPMSALKWTIKVTQVKPSISPLVRMKCH